jgi:hypothetical protein
MLVVGVVTSFFSLGSSSPVKWAHSLPYRAESSSSPAVMTSVSASAEADQAQGPKRDGPSL